MNGPEDAIVSDDQRKPMEKELHCCEVLSGTISGSDGISKVVEDRETSFFLRKPDAALEERNRKLHAEHHIDDVQVMCILCLLALGKRKKV